MAHSSLAVGVTVAAVAIAVVVKVCKAQLGKPKKPQEHALEESLLQRPTQGDSLRHKLTVLLTTSPVRRHPSTNLIDEVMASACLAVGTEDCDLIIVCDGYRRFNGEGKEFTEPNYRQGIVDSETAANYEEYKRRLRAQVEATQSTQRRVEIFELETRQGFGFAVKAALPKVRTPFVLVMQHDRVVLREVDIPRILSAMECNSCLKYVGLPTSTTVGHKEHVLSKYGLRLEPLTVDSQGLQVLPLIQWYDSMHIADTEYYRNFVFGRRKLVAQGGFIEDKFGQAQLADIRKRGVEAHSEWGTYVLFGHDFSEPCVGHLDGRDERNVRHFRHTEPKAKPELGLGPAVAAPTSPAPSRIDPQDGAERTLAQLLQICGETYTREEIQAYWDQNMFDPERLWHEESRHPRVSAAERQLLWEHLHRRAVAGILWAVDLEQGERQEVHRAALEEALRREARVAAVVSAEHFLVMADKCVKYVYKKSPYYKLMITWDSSRQLTK